ncbi:DegV family protein [Enterococcus hirae]|nr:DegV family protein [Enterococcus hirae]
MKIAVVTDSTAYLPPEAKQHPDLYILPVPFVLDGQTYLEGKDISTEEFYRRLPDTKTFPQTSQPPLGEVAKLYDQLAAQHYDAILSIHLSGGISGFVNTLHTVAEMMKEKIEILPFDSKITSLPMGLMVEKALEMTEQQKTLAEIEAVLSRMRDSVRAFIIVDDLNNLVRGGRLKNGAALIGGLLRIKPVLTFQDGKIVVFEKIRTSKKAIGRVQELTADEFERHGEQNHYFVIHGDNEQTATEEAAHLEKEEPALHLLMGTFGPVIGTHLGNRSLAFGWIAAE